MCKGYIVELSGYYAWLAPNYTPPPSKKKQSLQKQKAKGTKLQKTPKGVI
jgi:hypothetical protein